MASADFFTSSRERKLVVLGLPWDIDTEDLKQYMSNFGELDDVIVMKDRLTGHSRGFGYVTFSSAANAQKATAAEHVLNGRMLEVKVATPKEEMRPSATRKITRIFVARIPPNVTDEMFRRYFEKYGAIMDAYMPKDQGSRAHRGIGFVTFENADSVDKVMYENHELGGSTIAVDRATPKEDTLKFWGKTFSDSYSMYNAYLAAATQFGAFGPGGFGAYSYTGTLPSDMGPTSITSSNSEGNTWAINSSNNEANTWAFSSTNSAGNTWPLSSSDSVGNTWPVSSSDSAGGNTWVTPNGGTNESASVDTSATCAPGSSSIVPPTSASGSGNKIFIGRLPMEATAEHLRTYFSSFGRILDVYVPKDAKKKGHRGFGFVTFFDDGVAERVAMGSHEILGQPIAVDRPTPQGEGGANSLYNSNSFTPPSTLPGGTGATFQGSIEGNNSTVPGMSYGSVPGNLDYATGWGYYSGGVGPVASGDRTSRMDVRYRPY